MDIGSVNPKDAVWLTSLPALSVADAVPSHGWVEIAHCAQTPRKPRGYGAGVRHPSWKFGPAWFYVASGSGVSINVGRTLVFRRYGVASRWLARAVPGRLEQDGPAPANSAPPPLNFSGLNVSELDSVQILENNEYYSREPRHELVMLRMGEGAGLTSLSVMCGRHPHLSPCARGGAAALARLANCAPWATALSKRYRKLVRKCSHLPSRCYTNGSRFYCRQAG
eukprot:4282086-Prymnesium_polylepis.1